MAMDRKLQVFATEKGLKPVKNAAVYGFADQVFVMLERQTGGLYCLTIALSGAPAGGEEAYRDEIDLLLENHAKDVKISENGFFAYLYFANGSRGINALRELWQSGIFARLYEKGFAGGRRCMICGESIPEGEETCMYNGVNVLLMHGECANAYEKSVSAAAAGKGAKGLAGGVAGAMLGAVLGAALYFLVSMTGYIATMTGFATGFLCEWLYRKAGGPAGAVKVIVMVLALTLSVLAGNKAFFHYDLSKVYAQTDFAQMEISSPLDFAHAVWQGYIVGDYDDYLSWQYDLLLTQVEESDMDDILTREEFIMLYDDPSQDAVGKEMRGDLIKSIGQGMLYSLLGGAIFIVQAAKKNKEQALRV